MHSGKMFLNYRDVNEFDLTKMLKMSTKYESSTLLTKV